MRLEDVSDKQLIEEVRNRGYYTMLNGEVVLSKQPKALRIAAELESLDGTPLTCGAISSAAFELRRLHAENEQMRVDALVMLEKLRDWTLQYTDQEQSR